ncbi:NAD(P)-binding domain-containing protein, partial [Candidatus Saccharibacteria bacterium]|nr:NAD(P)-binding domain-containing protein [Candidatus Saccharibacteria bacterium]
MYDLIIIGGGPAGMTAGIYAARKKLKTLILTRDIGGQAAWSSDVENYPGFTMITGASLVEKFEHHVEEFKDVLELRLVTKGVSDITKEKTYFSVHTGDGHSEHARSVIIAGGKLPRPLGVQNEKEFLNRGVTYCAWCDGPLFAGKDVAIIGGGNSALDAA